jgi:hypothetical protein
MSARSTTTRAGPKTGVPFDRASLLEYSDLLHIRELPSNRRLEHLRALFSRVV